MTIETGFASVIFGLISAATWGIGDFSGGLATRRQPVRTVVIISQAVGLSIFVLLAILRAEPMSAPSDLLWGALAGVIGQIGIFALYQAMSIGQMGIAAPITAVLSATIPAIFGMITQGAPDLIHVIGFGMALSGVWLISRPAGATGRPAGIGLAIIGGCGFGGFLVLISQVHTNAIFWPLIASRFTSIAFQMVIGLFTVRLALPTRKVLPLIFTAGAMDSAGNAFFVLAEQAGRLDVAGVLSSLYPATTVLLAFVVLKEKLTRVQIIGVLLALIAVPLIAMK